MNITNRKYMLRELQEQNPEWFSKKNKRFFQDRTYFFMYSGKTGNPYLVRSTYGWSDMFDKPLTLVYRINAIDSEIIDNTYTGKMSIGKLLDDEFDSLQDVKKFLKTI